MILGAVAGVLAGGAIAGIVGALVAVVLAGHLSLAPKVADLDSFYHLGHAAAYAEGSVLETGNALALERPEACVCLEVHWRFFPRHSGFPLETTGPLERLEAVGASAILETRITNCRL